MWLPLLESSAASEGCGTKSDPAGRRLAAFFMLLMLNLESALGEFSGDWSHIV